MIKQLIAYLPPRCGQAKWEEEQILCSSDMVESEDFNSLTEYEW